MSAPAIITEFVARARAASAEVHHVENIEDALAWVAEMRVGRGPVAAAGWTEETLSELSARLGAEGLMRGRLRQHADAIGVGFTPASWGVAETGTVVIDSVDIRVRLASMLPEVHVVLLPESRVVARMTDLTQAIGAALSDAPGYLAMITGPSRTADVERVLTIGVHGPRQLHILLQSESGGAGSEATR
jgi:L-lactate dehydrogenase complex protein LldG